MPVARYEVEELRRLARRQGDTTRRAVAPETPTYLNSLGKEDVYLEDHPN